MSTHRMYCSPTAYPPIACFIRPLHVLSTHRMYCPLHILFTHRLYCAPTARLKTAMGYGRR